MKLKAPIDVCSASFNGEAVEINKDGEVEVTSAEAVAELKAHGFVEVETTSRKRVKAEVK